MTATEVLSRLAELGVTTQLSGDKLLLEPGSKVPSDLRNEVRQNKAEILSTLRRAGDDETPPLDRPPQTEQELRRWIDYTADPEVFARWLEWAMNYTDPVEDSPCPEDTPSG